VERLGIHTESAKAQLLTTPIKFDLAGKSGVTIDSFANAEGEAIYRLQWTLSLALARVAVLSACIEEDLKNEETLFFKSDSETFANHAYNFISNEVK
jgi:hypothetical protein